MYRLSASSPARNVWLVDARPRDIELIYHDSKGSIICLINWKEELQGFCFICPQKKIWPWSSSRFSIKLIYVLTQLNNVDDVKFHGRRRLCSTLQWLEVFIFKCCYSQVTFASQFFMKLFGDSSVWRNMHPRKLYPCLSCW